MPNSPTANNPNNSATANQILTDAGFFPPNVYDILTRFSSLQTQPDSLAEQYVPVTDVLPPAASQTLPFIIGFIPPASTSVPPNSSLSRQASVQANSPAQLGLPSGNNSGTATTISQAGANFIADHEGFNPNGNGAFPYGGAGAANNYIRDAIGYGHDIQKGEFSGNSPSGQPTFTIQGTTYTTPLTQAQATTILTNDLAWAQRAVTQNVTVPLTQNQFDSLTSYAYSTGAGGFKASTHLLSAVNSGDFAGAAAVLQSSTLDRDTGASNPQLAAIRNAESTNFLAPDGADLVRSGLNGAGTIPSTTPPNNNAVGGDVPNPSSWNQQGGSTSSQQAAQQASTTANTTLNSTYYIGAPAYLAQQAAFASTLNNLISNMAATPPLRFLVNPRSFKTSLEKVISDGNWGRSGPIIEHWGENLDKIEGSGKIAAFFSLDVTQTPVGGSPSWPGLTRMARQYSTAYQNFLSLYLIYRSNAGIWTQDAINNPATINGYPVAGGNGLLNLALMGSVYIYYDSIMYVGGFDNFTISESDEAPFSLEYSFTFTVRAWFEMDQQMDPELSFNAPVNGQAAPGVQPAPGSIPTQSAISQFGPAAGQYTNQGLAIATGAVGAPISQGANVVAAATR